MVRERANNGIPGIPMLLVLLLTEAALVWMLVMNIRSESAPEIVFAALMMALVLFLAVGLFMVNPNEGKVLQLFGEYTRHGEDPGTALGESVPAPRRRVSLRVRNFESSRLKVNDIDGNPIEIAAVVVWKVVDTAEAVFEVDDYENYVHVQSEVGAAQPRDELPVRRARRQHDLAARPHRRRSPSICSARSRSGWRRRAWR